MGLKTASGKKGVVASGHKETSEAAARVLEEGGNAFDAVLAGLCAATVAEPMLVSFGGGGFLVARPGSGSPRVYDFFCQTPKNKRPESEIDFYPFIADFGWTQQEFHIGMGAIAVPGLVAGLFDVHADLGRIPIREVVRPAIELAKNGIEVSKFQAEVLHVLRPIYDATPQARQLYTSPADTSSLLSACETQRFLQLAETMEWLSYEGKDVFYRGELATRLVNDCQSLGGMLTMEDLAQYRVERRKPVGFSYHGANIAINPPPSLGGGLVAFALTLLGQTVFRHASGDWGHEEHLKQLVRAMRGANVTRREFKLDEGCTDSKVEAFLDSEVIERWRAIPDSQLFSRGTTHISVADKDGDLASLTASNGEGCGYVLPDTDIMLNNMLGEEDLNPMGFHRWEPGTRLASMMSPAVAHLPDGRSVALGSGGSNRIRSAVTQVLVNLVDFEMSLDQAIQSPRIHLEKNRLSVESGFDESAVESLRDIVEELETWGDQNLFFGGVHAVSLSPDGTLSGYGDARRSGYVAFA